MLALNAVQYVVLWVLYVLRAWRYPRRFFGDMVDHARGTGYFTMVAATGILASQCIVLLGHVPLGFALWALAALLWLVLTYTIFTAFTIRRDKPPLDRGISGAWLLAVVSTQALAVSSALLAARIGQPLRLELNLLGLNFGVDFNTPALRLPAIGRLGMDDAPGADNAVTGEPNAGL